MDFADVIIKWYNLNKRDLPWRGTNDPYLIWLSEIILQQTRVDQGLPYFMKFKESFPTIANLALADEKEVLKLWQGLGYYSRARNLHATAKYVTEQFKGAFPATYKEIIKLKGVGQYTAGAIASFAFNEAQPVVDGNVYRVLSRYFGVETPIDSTAGKNYFYTLATELLDKKRPVLFNQAIMEFGAMHCMPKNPQCNSCPLATSCVALQKKLVNVLPVKTKKTKVTTRFFYYLVAETKTGIYVKQRVSNDIWKGLYDFPSIETGVELNTDELTALVALIFGTTSYALKSISETYKHILTHQRIYAQFITISITDEKNGNKNFFQQKVLKNRSKKPFPKSVQLHLNACVFILKSELKKHAVPRLIDRYLQAKKML